MSVLPLSLVRLIIYKETTLFEIHDDYITVYCVSIFRIYTESKLTKFKGFNTFMYKVLVL